MRSAALDTRLGIQPKRRRGHGSRLVDALRILLPLVALVLTGLVVAWPHLMGAAGGLIAPMLSPARIDGSDVMLMHNPRYLGETERAEPYEVIAESAYLDPLAPERVHLRQLAAELDKRDGRELRLVALEGIYQRAANKLSLAGGIELSTSDGYRFLTESAKVDLERGRVAGKQPITGSGPKGTLSADRFEIRDGGQLLRFRGDVKVTLQSGVK
jgi:lipopolysaccharide export system protein LptC